MISTRQAWCVELISNGHMNSSSWNELSSIRVIRSVALIHKSSMRIVVVCCVLWLWFYLGFSFPINITLTVSCFTASISYDTYTAIEQSSKASNSLSQYKLKILQPGRSLNQSRAGSLTWQKHYMYIVNQIFKSHLSDLKVSAKDGSVGLRKSHSCFASSLRSVAKVVFETVRNWTQIVADAEK